MIMRNGQRTGCVVGEIEPTEEDIKKEQKYPI